MPTETVLAISDQEENAYQALLQQSSRAFKIFNTGDDVLDHLANNTTPQDRGCGGIDGRDHVSSIYYINGNTWYKTEMHFNRYGVYFVLKGGFDSNDLTGIGGTVLVEIKGPQTKSFFNNNYRTKYEEMPYGTVSATPFVTSKSFTLGLNLGIRFKNNDLIEFGWNEDQSGSKIVLTSLGYNANYPNTYFMSNH